LELIRTVKVWIGNTEKLMFGSDYPFYTAETTIAVLDRIAELGAAPVTADDIDGIKNGNAEKFMKKYVFSKIG